MSLSAGAAEKGMYTTLTRVSGHSKVRLGLLATLAVCLTSLFCVSNLRAQALSGINGTVTDQSGAVVPGAKVTVTNVATNVSSSAISSSVGTYAITDLTLGTYTVKVEKSGFQTAIISGVNVNANESSTVNAKLKPGTVSQTVTVTAPSISLQTNEPQIGTVIQSKIIHQVPVVIGGGPGNIGPRDRQIDDYLFLAPGVTGGEFSKRFNGGVDMQNEVMFNGVPVVQSETQGMQSNINPPFEMVSQVNAITDNFSSKVALAQGVASYRFASGTNQLHGDVFELNRNSYFFAAGMNPNPGSFIDANGLFHQTPAPHLVENNWGFSLGGPVWIPKIYDGRNKTFFHVSLDWFHLNQANTGTMTVPSQAEVGGDFSNYINLSTGQVIPIYVPQNFTGAAVPAGCTVNYGGGSVVPTPGTQWPGNIIPASCFSANAKAILPLIPTPTSPSLQTNNINSQIGVLPTRQTNGGFTIDQHFGQKLAFHVAWWRDVYNTPAFDYNGYWNNELSALKTEPRLGTGFFLDSSYTFSPNLIMTAGLGWMGELNNEYNAHLGQIPTGFNAAAGMISMPKINFNGNPSQPTPTDYGVNANGETFSINRKLGISLVNNWLWLHGRNMFNIGWEFLRAYQDDHECQACGGSFSFSSLTTDNPAALGTAGSAFASFLLGDADSAYRVFVKENKLRNYDIAPYFQDKTQVTKRLSVNWGVRWDIMVPFTDINNNFVFFNELNPNSAAISPATGSPLLGTAGQFGSGCPACVGYRRANTYWHNFSPRLGLIYELNSKTVLQGGYSWNYLDGGAYEFGNNKASVEYGDWTSGTINISSLGTNIPQFGSWDVNKLDVPQAVTVTPTLFNGPAGALRYYNNSGIPTPYVQQWNFGVQRELPYDMILGVAYVGNRGVHLDSMVNPINQTNPQYLAEFCASGDRFSPNCPMSPASPNYAWTSAISQADLAAAGFGQFTYATGLCGNPNGPVTLYVPYENFCTDWGPNQGLSQALLPFPQYPASESAGGLTQRLDMSGSSLYNSLQVSVQKRFSSGLTFLVNYNLSRNLSNTDSGFSSFNFGALNGYDPQAEWTVSQSDQTHYLNIAGVYELPLGPGQRFFNHGGIVMKNLLGGWQLSGVFTYSTGTPLSAYYFNTNPFLNGFNRANYNVNIPLNVNYNNYYKGLPVFTTAAFSSPDFSQGSAPRDLTFLRNPNNANENLALAKSFYFNVGDHPVTAELRMEYFNILNRMQVCGPDTTQSDGPGVFGLVSPNGNGGSNPCQGNTPRQGQVFLRLEF